MRVLNGEKGVTIFNLNSLIEWSNISELTRILLGGEESESGFTKRAFGIEVRMFYLLLAEKDIDDLSDEIIDLAIDERLTALASLLPFEAAAVGGYADDDEYQPELPEEIGKYLHGKRRNFEAALAEIHDLDDDELISLLLCLEAHGIHSLGALNPMLISAIFTNELFGFSDFFHLLAAGIPLGFHDLVSINEIEESVF